MALIEIHSKKGQLMTLSVLLLLVLMLAELFSFALITINSNSILQSTSSATASNNYNQALSLSAQSFAQSSLSSALSALAAYEYSPNLRKDDFITNFSSFMTNLMQSGTLPNVSSSSAGGNFLRIAMGNLTFGSYNASISRVFNFSSARYININQTDFRIYQNSPYTLSVSYVEGVRINSTGNIYTYSIPIRATIPLNGTQDLFYAQQGVSSTIKFTSLSNQTTLIGNAYANASSNTFVYGTVVKVPSTASCANLGTLVPTNLQSPPYNSQVIIVTANAFGITGGCTGVNAYGGLITYNSVNTLPTVPYLIYASSSNVIASLQTGSRILLYGPGQDALDINNLKYTIMNGYYLSSPYSSSYISRAQGNFNTPSSYGIFSFANYNKQAAVFGQSSSNIVISAVPPSIPKNAITFSAWVFPYSDPGREDIIENSGTFFNLQNNQVCFYINNINSAYLCSTNTVPIDKWSYVSGSYNGNTEIVYINGQVSNTLTITGTAYYAPEAGSIGVCGAYCGNTGWFNGLISNIQSYNASLSPGQLGELYQQGISGLPINGGNLNGWWPLNGNSNDYSGNNNNGIAYNVIYSTIPNYTVDSALTSPISNTKLSQIPGILSCSTTSQCSSTTLPHLYLGYSPLSPQGGFDVASGSDRGQISINNNMPTLTSFTIVGWLNNYIPGAGQGGHVVYEQSECGVYTEVGSTDYAIGLDGCECEYSANDLDIGCNEYAQSNDLAYDQWYMIAVTVSSTGNVVSYAYNGINNLAFSYQNLGAQIFIPSGPAYLGDWSGDNIDYGLNGSLSDVQIYNTSLSKNALSSLYNEGIGGVPIDPQNLVAWWPLDGDAYDYSGHNYNGTATDIYFPNFYGNYFTPRTVGGIIQSSSNEWQTLGLGDT